MCVGKDAEINCTEKGICRGEGDSQSLNPFHAWKKLNLKISRKYYGFAVARCIVAFYFIYYVPLLWRNFNKPGSKGQTAAAVGCDELLEQDNPGGVARLCRGRCRDCVSWVEEGFCEGLTVQLGLKSPHLRTVKLFSWWKAGLCCLLGKSVCNTSEGGFGRTWIVAFVAKGVRQPWKPLVAFRESFTWSHYF